MPHVLENASVIFDGSDISAFVKSVRLNRGIVSLDQTVMGDDTQNFYPGLKNWSAEVSCVNSFASDDLDDVISAKFEARTVGTLSIKPSATAGDADNPEWEGSAFMSAYDPVAGTVGDLAMSSITFTAAGSLTRATATS